MAPFIALDIEIMPNDKFPVKTGMEYLPLQGISHIKQFRNQLKLIDILVFIDHSEYFSGFISDCLSQDCPVLIIVLFAPRSFLYVQCNDLLSNTN